MGCNVQFKFCFLIFLIFLLFSCFNSNIKKKTFIRENIDISYIKKVGVLTFENHTKEENAQEIVRDIVITEILANKIFDVVGKSITDAVITEETGSELTDVVYDKETLKRIARKLKVQGLIIGSVDEYGIKRDGGYSYPIVTLTLILIDGKTGIILWQSSATASGYSWKDRLLGIRGKNLNELTFEVVEKILKSLK